MKFGQNYVFDILIFDKEGVKVTELNTLKNCTLNLKTISPHLIAKDALLDLNVLKFIGKDKKNERSDYELAIQKEKYSTTISLTSENYKECKLVVKAFLREQQTGTDRDYLIEIPNAKMYTGISLETKCEDVSDFDLKFNIYPYSEHGDLVKIHIE